jgi:flagellar biosynthesis/type III secretory pathway protein FliH
MPPMQTINLRQPIAGACIVDAAPLPLSDCEWRMESTVTRPPSEDRSKELQEQQAALAQLLETVHGIADGLSKLQEQTLVSNRVEIAKLAVEIARKILMCKVGKGDYEIQAIVEEALKQAPTRQHIVIRLNPDDLPRCQQLQRENPQSPFAELEFTADWSIGRSECLVETPKGIVQSFLEEHLDHISKAMERVE